MIFTEADDFQTMVSIWQSQRNACEPGIEWCRAQGRIKCRVAFSRMVEDETFLDWWKMWILEHSYDLIDEKLTMTLIEAVVAKRPMLGVLLLKKIPETTKKETKAILKGFHSEHTPDHKSKLPTCEMELRDEIKRRMK